MTKLQIVLISIVSMITVGCVPVNSFHSVSINQPHAVILGNDSQLLSGKNENFSYVYSVDGKVIPNANVSSKIPVRVTPGYHEITISAIFYKHIFSLRGVHAKASFHLRFKANKQYRTQASIDGHNIKLWISDHKGNIVTRKIEKSVLPTGTQKVSVKALKK